MRIAYLCADPGVPVFGRKGCSIHVQEMLRALLRQGLQVELFAVRLGGDRPSNLKDVRVCKIQPFCHPQSPSDVALIDRANESLWNELSERPRFNLVYERYSLWCSAGMEFARSCGVPGVLEVNAPLIEEQARYRQLNAPGLAQHIAERTFEAADALCAVSSQVAHYLRRFPTTEGRVHVIPNGVDPARFQTQEAQQAEKTTGTAAGRGMTVGFVGSLKPWHGLATLATAFTALHRLHPEARLLVVGDGPARENLLSQLAAGGDAVLAASHLTGAVPSEEIPRYLSQMDVAVAPYPDLLGFYFSPLKIFEYMAAGRAVIASRIGDLPDILRDGIDGILCTPGDATELVAALDRLQGDPVLRRRLGESARARVFERHSWDTVARQILSAAGRDDVSPRTFPTGTTRGASKVVA